jgi:hypothetical protein
MMDESIHAKSHTVKPVKRGHLGNLAKLSSLQREGVDRARLLGDLSKLSSV